MDAGLRKALVQGVVEAACFVAGALLGWSLGAALGFDFVRTPGWGPTQMLGLVFIMLGCGAGRWAATRVLSRVLARFR